MIRVKDTSVYMYAIMYIYLNKMKKNEFQQILH